MSIKIFSGDESEAEAVSAGNNVCRRDSKAEEEARSADNSVVRHDRAAAGSICHRRDTSAAGHSGADAPNLCGHGVRFRFRGQANIYL